MRLPWEVLAVHVANPETVQVWGAAASAYARGQYSMAREEEDIVHCWQMLLSGR